MVGRQSLTLAARPSASTGLTSKGVRRTPILPAGGRFVAASAMSASRLSNCASRIGFVLPIFDLASGGNFVDAFW